MISYAGEGHERVSWSYGESSGKSSLKKFMGSISFGYELILRFHTIPMFTLWIGNAERYISGMKKA